jgi:hypothetical protein
MKKRKFPKKIKYLIPIFSIAIIIAGTWIAIQIGKGYRPSVEGLKGTGLLAANSFPPGAEVYINGRLTTATDDTLNLQPGEYTIDIKRDGYIPWQKTMEINAELVTQTNATLFKSVASLSPVTLAGATTILPSPDGQHIAFVVTNPSTDAKSGLYLVSLSNTPLTISRNPKQLARSSPRFNFENAKLLWSPDSSQILVQFTSGSESVSNYLLGVASYNELETLRDVSVRLGLILSQWEEDIALRETEQFALLPGELAQIATASATNIYFSPNEEKVMYTSTEYATLPQNLAPARTSSSTQPEERELVPGGIYIYDRIEDKNFRIGEIELDNGLPTKNFLLLDTYQPATPSAQIATPSPETPDITAFTKLQAPDFDTTIDNFNAHYSSLYHTPYQWYPNSTHVIVKLEGKIDIMEYDRTNWVTLYSGPFEDNFIYPWPDGSKLIILTNLNPSSDLPLNLYAIDIR